MGHCSNDSGRNVNRFGGNAQDANNHASIENVRDPWDVCIFDCNDEWRSGDTTTAKQSFVIRRDQESNKRDAQHVNKDDAEWHQLGRMSHREAWALRLTAHDADEDLVAHCPCGEKQAVRKSLIAVSDARYI